MCLAQGPKHSDAGEARTRGPYVSSQALYHCAPRGGPVFFRKIIICQGSKGGPTFSRRGGGSTFSKRGGGGGVQMLIFIETYQNSDFSGRGSAYPPLGPRMFFLHLQLGPINRSTYSPRARNSFNQVVEAKRFDGVFLCRKVC